MFIIRFGAASASVSASASGEITVDVPGPVLAGEGVESFPIAPGKIRRAGDWVWSDNGNFLCGAAVATVGADDLESVTRRLYAGLFEGARGLHLYRVWHHVPAINAEVGGRPENYRRFCVARGEAFDRAFPGDNERRMPAASVLGVPGDRIVIIVFAGRAAPEHLENPEQTPAYRYPEKYGARAPSFARATRVTAGGGAWVFISGTAAIKGSDSLHPGDVCAQARVARHNVGLIRSRAGADRAPALFHASRVYLRRADDLAVARETLGFEPPGPACSPLFLAAEICRRELLIEIEETLFF